MKLFKLFENEGNNMQEVQAPDSYADTKSPRVFLAGSIEMGKAEPWQDKLVKAFKDKNVTFLNPRRDDWDSNWKQEIGNKQFRQQVEWELQAMEDANVIIMYFDPKTQSPITLLELGLYSKSKKPLIVCCPEGFWRKGNVDVVCNFYKNAKVVKDFDELSAELNKLI